GRVIGQDLLDAVALPEQADDRGDRDASTRDARHPAHYAVVDSHADGCHVLIIARPEACPPPARLTRAFYTRAGEGNRTLTVSLGKVQDRYGCPAACRS